MDKEKEKIYTLIDIDGLSTCLAEENWLVDTKNIRLDDLYEYDTVEMPYPIPVFEIKKTVRSKWAHLFFALKDKYNELIYAYKKPDVYGSDQEGTADRPEGTY